MGSASVAMAAARMVPRVCAAAAKPCRGGLALGMGLGRRDADVESARQQQSKQQFSKRVPGGYLCLHNSCRY